jgi:hypothetical protein
VSTLNLIKNAAMPYPYLFSVGGPLWYLFNHETNSCEKLSVPGSLCVHKKRERVLGTSIRRRESKFLFAVRDERIDWASRARFEWGKVSFFACAQPSENQGMQ